MKQWEIVDREAWRAVFNEIAKSQTQLRDRTMNSAETGLISRHNHGQDRQETSKKGNPLKVKSVEKGLDCGVAVGMREDLTKTQLLFQGPAHIPPSVYLPGRCRGPAFPWSTKRTHLTILYLLVVSLR